VENLQRGRGGEENFRVLFDNFFPQVQRFFAKRVFSSEDRLDLTQETFLRIYKGIGGYRGEAQVGTWVFRIAYNTWLQWLRKESGHETISVTEVDSEAGVWDEEERTVLSSHPSPLEKTLNDERRKTLRTAIERLPEKMRQCTELRIYQDLSYREIATIMRLSIETVKVHLFQARKKLRDSMEEIDF
jgi:RNA polymerase sigma-70 factor (ECF subfamily)